MVQVMDHIFPLIVLVKATFVTQNDLHKLLHLKLLFKVSNITKNLLSVSQFTKDNKVSFEFFPQHCHVKDLQTQTILARVIEVNGLYKLNMKNLSDPKQVYHATAATDIHKSDCTKCSNLSTQELRRRPLGHVSSSVLSKLAFTSLLPIKFIQSSLLHLLHQLVMCLLLIFTCEIIFSLD